MFKRTLLTLALGGCVPATALAYSATRAWPSDNVDFVSAPSSWSDLLKSFSLLWAETIVNDGPSQLTIDIGEDTDSTFGPNNGVNEIAWTTDMAAFCSSVPDGCALVETDGTEITEADVIIDANVPLEYYADRSDGYAYGGGYRPMVPLLLHELGHAVGLSHENTIYNVMGIEYEFLLPAGEEYIAYLGTDASAGLRSLYGSDSSRHDLTITHWRYDSASGQYSNHRRTSVKTAAGSSLSTTTVDGETAYKAAAGTALKVEATYENAGTSSQTSTVRYYLSSDREITTADTSLGTASVSFSASAPNTTWSSVTLPSSLKAGSSWFIGAIADSSGTLSEANEDNNAVYLAQVYVTATASSGSGTAN